MKTKTIKQHIENLLSHAKHNPDTLCLEWIGMKNKKGYGLKEIREKNYKVHRLMYEFINGPIPELFEGLPSMICHHCDNPACILPFHLFLGNNKINMWDMTNKNVNKKRKLNKQQVLEIREKYATGKYFRYELAEEYNVSTNTIFNITKKYTYYNF